MIQIKQTILSNDLFQKKFVCDLTACKGACCVEGDAGAPLEKEELAVLDAIFEKVKPYLSPAGVKAIESQGKYIQDDDGEYVTHLINGKECAYTVFDSKGTAMCGIELAHKDQKISFKKPISCHLYPIRITKYSQFDALNYHEWKICSPACFLGEKLSVKVYQFLKEPLIRKYGEEWYNEVVIADKTLFD
jgi:hypothetical protein